MSDKKPFSRQMGDNLLAFLCFASENDAEPRVRAKIVDFASRPYTSPQLYDLLAEISAEGSPSVAVGGGRISVGYVSGMVHSACNVTAFYDRPSEDQPSPLPTSLREQFRRPILDRRGNPLPDAPREEEHDDR